MSLSVCTSSIAIRSIEPIVPPASPIAVATRPSMPGRWSIRTRSTKENWADVGNGTAGRILVSARRGRRGGDVRWGCGGAGPAEVGGDLHGRGRQRGRDDQADRPEQGAAGDRDDEDGQRVDAERGAERDRLDELLQGPVGEQHD